MGYKTFEDMKHNIPEGATHYHNESDGYHFCWFKFDGNKWFVNFPDKNEKWYACYREQYRDGIVQFIQTESPQEREALDMIGTTSKQVESLAKGDVVEWDGEGLPPVGVECCFTPDNNLWGFASTDTYLGEVLRYEGEQFVFLLSHDEYNMRPCHLIASRTDKGEFSKPESQEQKAERERLEAAYDLYCTQCESQGVEPLLVSKFTECGLLKPWLSIVDKTGYRKQ